MIKRAQTVICRRLSSKPTTTTTTTTTTTCKPQQLPEKRKIET